MIVRMAKIRIVGPKSLFEQVTDLIQTLGVVHIESLPLKGLSKEVHRLERFWLDPDHTKKKVETDRMIKELDRLIVALPEIRSPESRLILEERACPEEDRLMEIRGALETAKGQIESLLNQIREAEEESSLVARYERILEAMAPLLGQIQDVKELDSFGLVLEVPATESAAGGSRQILAEIRQALDELTDHRYELFLSRIDQETVAGLLVVPRELSSRVRAFLWEENISELRLPSFVEDKPVRTALKILLQRRMELPARLQQLRDDLRDLSIQWRDRLKMYKRILENCLARLESTEHFYQTRSTFVMYGWIPEKDFTNVQRRLAETFQGKVVMERMGIMREDVKSIPVALENPPLMKPFETLTRLVALPRYGSIDPTPYLAVFFPVFYGLILGDIGYGVILLGLSLYARRRWGSWPLVRDLSVVFIFASLWAIIFGFFYGECFGEMGEFLGIHPLLFNRMEGFLLLLKITIGIGLFHVLLGVALGLMTAVRHRDFKETAVKVCGLGFLLSVLMMVSAFMDLIDRFYADVGGVLALISLVLLFVLGGARGTMELHNVVNVLSYLRLMGIGVASAALAFAANTLGGLVGNVLLGALVMVIFHLINLVFGIFSPTIQALRLHYVEFFENFFLGGGREYRPFRRV